MGVHTDHLWTLYTLRNPERNVVSAKALDTGGLMYRSSERGRFGEESGAAEGTRTPDPIITNDVLYQLSYSGAFLPFCTPGGLLSRVRCAVFRGFRATAQGERAGQ